MKRVLPEITATTRDGSAKVTLRLLLPPDLHYFKGHFPISPILPGVAQLDWAIRYAREYFPIQGDFKGMEALKFQQVLLPGESPDLELEFKPEKNSAQFRYVSARGRHSSGNIFFG